MRFLTPVIVAALALSAVPSAIAQQIKIGTVDMKRVFQDYYKTKEAEKKVNEDKATAKKELDERKAKQRELMQKYVDDKKVAEDKLVNEELRQQKIKALQGTANEIKALEREIDEFTRRRESQLQEQVVRMRKGLLEDIKIRVEELSKKNNYDLVFDKSGMSPSGVPFLLHTRDAVDFSTEVLGELNKNAPADAAPAPKTP